MQRLLNHAVWDEHDAMGIVRDFVVEHLGDPDAVAVLDETGQEKKGEHTAGVKRQYVGCAGQVTNAINIVYCTYTSSRGPGGDAATKPAPAGSINGHDSNARPKQHDQVTKCGCRTTDDPMR